MDADFIIIGAGSAGCVLANRLSADGQTRVLLLEAGPRDLNPWLHIPLGYGKLFGNHRLNWMYQTEPESELGGRRIYQPRGKVLGGSSAVNGLIYMRGQAADYNAWRQKGNSGWGYDDVLPYFRRAEDNERGGDPWHGAGGPLAVSNPRDGSHPLAEAFIDACKIHGILRNDDFNGAAQEGAGYFQTTSRGGIRCSAATAYLRPARRRRNLRILTGAQAARILFDGNRAVGVAYHRAGQDHEARACAEVILCGGAINSPQLLELSGIGDGQRLQKLGISTRIHRPQVGENLQDHFQVRLVMRARRPVTINDAYRTLWGRIGMGLRYAATRRGPLSVSAGIAGAFFRSRTGLETPDIQVHFVPFSTDAMGAALHPYSGFTASICPLRPESRGSVHSVSPDPFIAPEIRANYLSTTGDRLTVVNALKRLRAILAADPMMRVADREMIPGPETDGDNALLAYARKTGSTIYHPTCTCAMGPGDDAVVTPDLRVRGIDGLRVVDGSIMPDLVSGNTNAPIIMIAEKAADMILKG